MLASFFTLLGEPGPQHKGHSQNHFDLRITRSPKCRTPQKLAAGIQAAFCFVVRLAGIGTTAAMTRIGVAVAMSF